MSRAFRVYLDDILAAIELRHDIRQIIEQM
jgi:hypothetical protein